VYGSEDFAWAVELSFTYRFDPRRRRPEDADRLRGEMRRVVVPLLLLAFANSSEADPRPATAAEIAHLLAAVEASQCTFIRNGTPHPSAEARAHMEMKYDHMRGRVARAEDFIELVGSQSSITGRPYVVDCTDEPQRRSHDWLLECLHAFRDGTTHRP
jgi:hypothetical protein